MLIRFQVSNFLSFHKEIEFSMVPGRTRKLARHVVKGENRYDISILRGAVIYGPNAAGKSNLVKAMAFARDLIVSGTTGREAIQRQPFKLARGSADRPSKFAFEFKHSESAYGYGFELDSRQIHSEWLYEIKRTTESMLFERTTSKNGETSVDFGRLPLSNKDEKDFLHFVARGTRPNQLLLTECIERNVKQFETAYRWFSEQLEIVYPETQYLLLGELGQNHELSERITRILENFGTGISGFDLEAVDPETAFPDNVLSDLQRVAREEPMIGFLASPNGSRYIVEVDPRAEIRARRLMLKHRMSDCDDEVLFEMEEESDGTRRLLDLLPFLTAAQKGKVLVVDELDRSLHPEISRQFIRAYLLGGNTGQLIVTTHDSTLLDLELLRRDEIWFVEKDESGASAVYSLEEFAPRYDKDIEKGYLLGRFGAVPAIRENPMA